jgi:hypothetical protein
MPPEPNKNNAETLQVGVMPVQSFVSEAIPVVPGMQLEPRRGRPKRPPTGQNGQAASPQDKTGEQKDTPPKTDE